MNFRQLVNLLRPEQLSTGNESENQNSTHNQEEVTVVKKGRGRPKGSKASKKKKLIKKDQADSRNEKNVFTYILKRFKRMLKYDDTFLKAITRGAFREQISLTQDDLIKIEIKKKCISKTELMKLLFLIRKNMTAQERKEIHGKMMSLVQSSILHQLKKYGEQNDKVVKEYELVRETVNCFLESNNCGELRNKIFFRNSDPYRNKGVIALQEQKWRKSLEEFCDKLEERWDNVFTFQGEDNIRSSDMLLEEKRQKYRD